MASDIHDFESRLRNQFENLESDHDDGAITDADHDAIRQFSIARNQEEGVTSSTVASDLSTLRTQAARCQTYYDHGLTDMDGWPDVREFVHDQMHDSELGRGGGGVSKGSSAKYRAAIRKLLLHVGFDWADEIDTKNYEDYGVDRDARYIPPDVRQKVLDHARNERDAALIAMLRETGQRIGALGTLRIGDVDPQPSERYGVIRLNPDAAGLKGAKGPRHLATSRPYVAAWYDRLRGHGFDDDDPFFTALPGQSRVDPGEPLRYGHLRRRIRLAADDAGVDDLSLVAPHNWRHSAITDMISRGHSEAQVKYIAGWSKDSSLFEVYDENTEEDMMRSVLRDEDLLDEDGEERDGPGVVECPNPRCRETLAGAEEFCPSCGDALTPHAADAADDARDDATADLADPDTTDEQRETVKHLLDAIESNPELAEAVAEAATNAETADAGD